MGLFGGRKYKLSNLDANVVDYIFNLKGDQLVTATDTWKEGNSTTTVIIETQNDLKEFEKLYNFNKAVLVKLSFSIANICIYHVRETISRYLRKRRDISIRIVEDEVVICSSQGTIDDEAHMFEFDLMARGECDDSCGCRGNRGQNSGIPTSLTIDKFEPHSHQNCEKDDSSTSEMETSSDNMHNAAPRPLPPPGPSFNPNNPVQPSGQSFSPRNLQPSGPSGNGNGKSFRKAIFFWSLFSFVSGCGVGYVIGRHNLNVNCFYIAMQSHLSSLTATNYFDIGALIVSFQSFMQSLNLTFPSLE